MSLNRINRILILLFYIFVFRYLKMSKVLSATCYQNIKERLQKQVKDIYKNCERYGSLSEEIIILLEVD